MMETALGTTTQKANAIFSVSNIADDDAWQVIVFFTGCRAMGEIAHSITTVVNSLRLSDAYVHQ